MPLWFKCTPRMFYPVYACLHAQMLSLQVFVPSSMVLSLHTNSQACMQSHQLEGTRFNHLNMTETFHMWPRPIFGSWTCCTSSKLPGFFLLYGGWVCVKLRIKMALHSPFCVGSCMYVLSRYVPAPHEQSQGWFWIPYFVV